MPVGRKRKSHHHLPSRVSLKHGAYYFIHRDGRWEQLAKVGDEATMRSKWAVLYGVKDDFGTVNYWMDHFLVHRAELVKVGKLGQRTYDDNQKESVYLKAYFGQMYAADVLPAHVGGYLDQRGKKAWVRANREKALLSAMYTWLMRKADSGIKLNPCRGVKRNTETKRINLVSDADYMAVYQRAATPVKIFMDLLYRTLQRPEDLIVASPMDIKTVDHQGQRVKVLRVEQAKVEGRTGKVVDVVITSELEAILTRAANDNPKPKKGQPATAPVVAIDRPFIHTRKGKGFTYDGLTAMFKRYVAKALEADKEAAQREGRPVTFNPFSPYDLKGKGATDMYRNGVPLERIQQLLGHASITTTEIYIKARLPDVAMPNDRKMEAADGTA